MKQHTLLGHPVGKTLYPDLRRRRMSLKRLRQWVLYTLLFAGVLCIFLNLLIGGFPWSAYVVVSEIVFYTAFLSWQAVENSLLQKLTNTGLASCALLLVIEGLSGGIWASRWVVPILFFAVLCLQGVVFYARFKTQRGNLVSPALMAGVGLVAALSLTHRQTFGWPWIVLLGVTAAMVAVGYIWFRKPLWEEWKKKIHR